MTNTDDEELRVDLWAVFYDAEGRVPDADIVFQPLLFLASGENLPFDFDDWRPLNSTTGLLDRVERFTIWWTVPDYKWVDSLEDVDMTTANDAVKVDETCGPFTGQGSTTPVDSLKRLLQDQMLSGCLGDFVVMNL